MLYHLSSVIVTFYIMKIHLLLFPKCQCRYNSTPLSAILAGCGVSDNVTTEEVKECQHNWVEVMTTKEEPDYDEHICLYCGYSTTGSVDGIIDHVSNCGGIWTHEELTSAGVTPEDAIYQVRIGRAKGTTYTTKTHYKYIEVGTGKYYCDKCYHTKQN